MKHKLKYSVLTLAMLPSVMMAQSPAQQPNFVIVLVDDLGWADVTCNYPESFYETPNIDRMAEQGVRFSQAYAAHPVCSPTRAAIMTGKHPNRVGITDWIPGDAPKDRKLLGPAINNELALEEVTLAEKLREAGYKTFLAGKWHLGDEGFYPEDQGFDINKGGHHKGSPPGGYYSPYKNPKLTDGPEGEYLTDRLTNESIRFMEANRDNPFLLYLAYYTVHTPIEASKKHIEKYRQKREAAGIEEVPHRQEGEGWTKLLQENAAYASMVAAMDENIGRLMDALRENGLEENTWVIFTSDNGGLSTLRRKNAPTALGPLRAGKGWCYEGGIRVPLVITGPGVSKPGRTVEEPVVSMDFFPTLMSLAGIDNHPVDGTSLTPLLAGGKSLKRNELFWHYPHYHGSGWVPGSALRKDDWKLIYFYEDERMELYNLKNDPSEENNLAAQKIRKTRRMKQIMDQKMEETGARFPVKRE